MMFDNRMGMPQRGGFAQGRPMPQQGGNAMSFIMQNGMERARAEQTQRKMQEQMRLQAPVNQKQMQNQGSQSRVNRPQGMAQMPQLMGPQAPNMAMGGFGHMAQAGNLGNLKHMAFAQGAAGPTPGMGMPQGMAQMGPALGNIDPSMFMQRSWTPQVQAYNPQVVKDFRARMPTMRSQGWRDMGANMGGGLAGVRQQLMDRKQMFNQELARQQSTMKANYGFGQGQGQAPMNGNYLFRGY